MSRNFQAFHFQDFPDDGGAALWQRTHVEALVNAYDPRADAWEVSKILGSMSTLTYEELKQNKELYGKICAKLNELNKRCPIIGQVVHVTAPWHVLMSGATIDGLAIPNPRVCISRIPPTGTLLGIQLVGLQTTFSPEELQPVFVTDVDCALEGEHVQGKMVSPMGSSYITALSPEYN